MKYHAAPIAQPIASNSTAVRAMWRTVAAIREE